MHQTIAKKLPWRALAIGGSDSGGSAGIQADLKTMAAHQVFGTTAITAVTAQNTLGVQRAMGLPVEMIEAQIEAVLNDIGADAIKTGLLGRVEVVGLVAEKVADFREGKGYVPLVVDPVLVNGSGARIVAPEVVAAYRERLFPLAGIITPNLDEACWLAEQEMVKSVEGLYEVARALYGFGSQAVLVKGGHLDGAQKVDLFFDGTDFIELTAPTLPIENPHGVGCTLASAIASQLARGETLVTAVQNAHAYLQKALHGALGWQLGQGRLPVNHQV